MSELPKDGEEWFHRETLTLAHVLPETENIKAVVISLCGGVSGQRFDDDAESFLRDYARNEPVTPELLERMNGGQWSLNQIATLNVYACSKAAEILVEDACTIDVAFPETLRDLIRTLRVFGIKDSIIPAATDTEPTAKA